MTESLEVLAREFVNAHLQHVFEPAKGSPTRYIEALRALEDFFYPELWQGAKVSVGRKERYDRLNVPTEYAGCTTKECLVKGIKPRRSTQPDRPGHVIHDARQRLADLAELEAETRQWIADIERGCTANGETLPITLAWSKNR